MPLSCEKSSEDTEGLNSGLEIPELLRTETSECAPGVPGSERKCRLSEPHTPESVVASEMRRTSTEQSDVLKDLFLITAGETVINSCAVCRYSGSEGQTGPVFIIMTNDVESSHSSLAGNLTHC